MFRYITCLCISLDKDIYLDFMLMFSAGYIGKSLADYFLEEKLLLFADNTEDNNPTDSKSNPPVATSSYEEEKNTKRKRDTSSDTSEEREKKKKLSISNLITTNTDSSSSESEKSSGSKIIEASTRSGYAVDIPMSERGPHYQTDTDNSTGTPMSTGRFGAFIENIVEENASESPEHRIDDPTGVTRRGYIGGGNFDHTRVREVSTESDVSNADSEGNPILQPFASNLANYLENYRNDNKPIGSFGYPKMDRNSLVWFTGYLNHNFNSYYASGHLGPTSSRIIKSLRDEN